MNLNRYIYYLLQTPIGTISLDDELFLRDILGGSTSAYIMHRTMQRSYELRKKSYESRKDMYEPGKISDPDISHSFELSHYLFKPPAYININKGLENSTS